MSSIFGLHGPSVPLLARSYAIRPPLSVSGYENFSKLAKSLQKRPPFPIVLFKALNSSEKVMLTRQLGPLKIQREAALWKSAPVNPFAIHSHSSIHSSAAAAHFKAKSPGKEKNGKDRRHNLARPTTGRNLGLTQSSTRESWLDRQL